MLLKHGCPRAESKPVAAQSAPFDKSGRLRQNRGVLFARYGRPIAADQLEKRGQRPRPDTPTLPERQDLFSLKPTCLSLLKMTDLATADRSDQQLNCRLQLLDDHNQKLAIENQTCSQEPNQENDDAPSNSLIR